MWTITLPIFQMLVSGENLLDPPGADKNAYSIIKKRIFSSFHERSVRYVALRLWNCRALETGDRYSSEGWLANLLPRGSGILRPFSKKHGKGYLASPQHNAGTTLLSCTCGATSGYSR